LAAEEDITSRATRRFGQDSCVCIHPKKNPNEIMILLVERP
jgi:hypothetical protein